MTPIRPTMVNICNSLDSLLNGINCQPENRKTGFVLLVFDMNLGLQQDANSHFMSNTGNNEVLKTLKVMQAQLEGQKIFLPDMGEPKT